MKPRILLVEDDDDRAEMLVRVLSEEYDCTRVPSAEAALHAIYAGGWDAIVVDFNLEPSGSGLEVIEAARLFDPRALRVLYSRDSYGGGLVHAGRSRAGAHVVLDAHAPDFVANLLHELRVRLATDVDSPAPGAQYDAADVVARWCAAAPATIEFLRDLREAALARGPVFVYGERGAGKHLAAATLQYWRAEEGIGRASTETGPTRAIEVPPLRDRRADLPGLVDLALADFAELERGPRKSVSPALMSELARRAWWGNVRELRAKLHGAARRAGTRLTLRPDDLPPGIEPSSPGHLSSRDRGQRATVLLQLKKAGSIRGAAKLAGLDTPNLRRLMRRLGIDRADGQDAD